jgi:spore coat protein U-like protein
VTRRIFALLLALAPLPAAAFVTCSFSSTPGMAFGPYDDSSATATDSSTSIVVRCLRIGTPSGITVALGPSANSGTIATRQMRSGANPMNYNLYRDSARALVWGNTANVDTVTSNAALANNNWTNVTFTIYGRIPALQNVPAGAYTDSVQITVSP